MLRLARTIRGAAIPTTLKRLNVSIRPSLPISFAQPESLHVISHEPSSSRSSITPTARRVQSWSHYRKGKARESLDHHTTLLSRDHTSYRYPGTTSIRQFHSTARRDAVPLLPAGLAILKSTSLLAVITTISRIMISFFPIGTIAAFRQKRIMRWLEEQEVPTTTPRAEEFFKMWCEGEKHIRITSAEANEALDRNPEPDGGVVLADGRVVYAVPTPSRPSFRGKNWEDQRREKRIQWVQRTRFRLPPLPEASVPYFERLPAEEQTQITALRRYYAGLTMFKNHLQISRIVVLIIFILPFVLLSGVYISALERVPLTGRWRIILLTPEEEDKISTSLAGGNWYKSVINLLTTAESPAPPVVPLDDWRWEWVRGVLRSLESAVINESQRIAQNLPPSFTDPESSGPRVPWTGYPLKPRPRVSSRLHSALPGSEKGSGAEHLELGPPYSLMLMEKDERNAFSYGFGGKGAGGIVVFTGLLDDILSKGNPEPPSPPSPRGFFSTLFGSAPLPPPRPRPTPDQSLQLASVLAHEMGHLLLSHHLETLSQQQVLWPSVLNLSLDLIRAFVWPFTFLLGPTVNDALANVGRTSAEDLADKYGEIGFQWRHEYEADFAAIRLLASAGYDPRLALHHFKASVADLHEIQPVDKDKKDTFTGSLFKLWSEKTHPSPEMRYSRVLEELKKWEWRDGKGVEDLEQEQQEEVIKAFGR